METDALTGMAGIKNDAHHREAAATNAGGKKKVSELIEKLGLETVQLAFVDMQGVVRGKFVPSRFFIEQMEHGANFCTVAMGWDVQCDIVADISYASWSNGYGDMLARPDLSTFQVVPWREKTGFVLCDLYWEDGSPLEFSPRSILKNIIAEYREYGYEPMMASELEFYLLKPDMTPLYEGIHCYNLFKGGQAEPILRDVRKSMETLDIYIEASNTEYGPGQTEVNLRYSDALDTADKTCLFKYGVKEIARSHGLNASFMSKIWEGESGNGYHVHTSLTDKDGKNIFLGPGHEMSDVMRHYLAGLLRHAAEFYVLGSWSVNAYKRQAAYSYAPTQVNWGFDNRTTAIRGIVGGKATRLEARTGSAEANPYLLFAANLVAGLEGIKQHLEPPERVTGDGYLPGLGEPLPNTLYEATDLFAGSATARKYFGDTFVDTFATICRHEANAFQRIVHQWERERYLEMV